jgi:4-amino-4-deoxychorismate lyase
MSDAAFLLNGQPLAGDDPALRALAQVNYGHFTSLQVRAGAAQGLGLHLQRLARGNTELFDAALDEAVLRGWMAAAASALGGDCSLRVTVFSRQFDHRQPLREVELDVLVAASAPVPVAPRALRVQTRPYVREAPQLKHVGTFPLFLHRREALKAGFDDALFVDGSTDVARVVEGSVWNIGFWDGTRIIWPEAPALRGTTEALLRAGLQALGCPQQVRPVARAELAGFQSAFAANASGLQSIRAIDAVEYAANPQLAALLHEAKALAPWESLA